MKTIIVLATWLMMVATSAAATIQEQIGSWVLSCPNAAGDVAGVATAPGSRSAPCLLRFEKRFFDKAGITGDLEILADGKSLVPVLTLRGVSSELLTAATLAGTTEASIRLNNGPTEALDCTASSGAYICLPRNDAARVLAAGLPTARSVTVRVSVGMAGMKPLPVQEKSLALSGTSEALVRLRTAGPSQLPGPTAALASSSPARLMGMADGALKAAGYPNGIADLRALMAKYRNK